MTPEVAQALQNYNWPGNVRELEHLIERSILLSNDDKLREIHLPGINDEPLVQDVTPPQALEAMERYHIIGTLKRCGGKIGGEGGAAEILDIPSTTLHSKMRRLKIIKKDYK
jgi:DNA-binding NtrC family response regulator